MEEIISGEARTTEEHAKHHLTLEEQLAQLEAKDKIYFRIRYLLEKIKKTVLTFCQFLI